MNITRCFFTDWKIQSKSGMEWEKNIPKIALHEVFERNNTVNASETNVYRFFFSRLGQKYDYIRFSIMWTFYVVKTSERYNWGTKFLSLTFCQNEWLMKISKSYNSWQVGEVNAYDINYIRANYVLHEFEHNF